MAITGLGLSGFLVGHLAGNLLMYAGQDAMNAYAKGLKDMPAVVWGARCGLLVFFLSHICVGIKLTFANRCARPERYRKVTTQESNVAAKSMIWSGLVLLAFVVFHLAHFTFLCVNSEYANLTDALGRHDVYTMVVKAFQNPAYSGVYIFCMILMATHLWHGLASLLQTLGINHPKYNCCFRLAGRAIAILLAIGFISIPISVLTGCIRLPEGVL